MGQFRCKTFLVLTFRFGIQDVREFDIPANFTTHNCNWAWWYGHTKQALASLDVFLSWKTYSSNSKKIRCILYLVEWAVCFPKQLPCCQWKEAPTHLFCSSWMVMEEEKRCLLLISQWSCVHKSINAVVEKRIGVGRKPPAASLLLVKNGRDR